MIDINSGTPVITPVGNLPVGLHWANATVVPDGRVVVTGGGPVNNQLAGANHNALIWNPANPGVWTVGAQTGTTAGSLPPLPLDRHAAARRLDPGRRRRRQRYEGQGPGRSTPTPSSTTRLICSRRPASGRRGRGSCRRRRC